MALSAYRNLLRATRIAFQEDFHLLHAARTQARTGFDSLRTLDADSEEAIKGVQHAEGVAQVLRHNLVQGKQIEGSDVLRTNAFGGREDHIADLWDRAQHTQGHGER